MCLLMSNVGRSEWFGVSKVTGKVSCGIDLSFNVFRLGEMKHR